MARDPIIDEMARTLWVLAWADAEEEHGGRAYPGTNLMDVAPETPPEAWDAANQLVGQFCGINECGIHTLLYRAARADAEANKVFEGAVVGESTLFDNERYQRAFGYSLAMEAVGHGRSEEHTSELQSLMSITYAVFCLQK